MDVYIDTHKKFLLIATMKVIQSVVLEQKGV